MILGIGTDGEPVFLADIWPSAVEVQETIDATIDADMFTARASSPMTMR